jgi:hypothetical protein
MITSSQARTRGESPVFLASCDGGAGPAGGANEWPGCAEQAGSGAQNHTLGVATLENVLGVPMIRAFGACVMPARSAATPASGTQWTQPMNKTELAV